MRPDAVGELASQDAYRGLLTEPRSLHRYGYVANNPTTVWDVLGFAASSFDWRLPGSSNSCVVANPSTPCKDAGLRPVPATPPGPVSAFTGESVKEPKAISKSYEQRRHATGAKASVPNWVKPTIAIFSTVGFVAGIVGWVPGAVGLTARVLGAVAGAIGAGLACVSGTAFDCIVAIIGAAVAGIGLSVGIATAVMRVSRDRIVPWFVQQLDGGVSAVGNSGDLLAVITGWGDYLGGLLR